MWSNKHGRVLRPLLANLAVGDLLRIIRTRPCKQIPLLRALFHPIPRILALVPLPLLLLLLLLLFFLLRFLLTLFLPLLLLLPPLLLPLLPLVHLFLLPLFLLPLLLLFPLLVSRRTLQDHRLGRLLTNTGSMACRDRQR